MLENFNKRPNRKKARSIASKLIKDCIISKPPIRLATVLKFLNIHIYKGDPTQPFLKKISAFIDLEDKLIVYNPEHHVVRQRFSVAHELGHYLMKHSIKNDVFSLHSKDLREIEANIFAAELLIPFGWIKKDLKSFNASIPELAGKYWVSEEAMGWRIAKSDVLTLS